MPIRLDTLSSPLPCKQERSSLTKCHGYHVDVGDGSDAGGGGSCGDGSGVGDDG